MRCFIDSGSMITFATPRLIQKLPGVRPKARVELSLQGFASSHAVIADRYALQLVSMCDRSRSVLLQVHEHDFNVDPPSNCSEEMRRLIRTFGPRHPLSERSLVDPRFEMEPDLLIGVDQMYKILHLNSERLIGGGLIVSGSFGPRTTRGDVVRVHPTCCLLPRPSLRGT